jgi:hypothetical protein
MKHYFYIWVLLGAAASMCAQTGEGTLTGTVSFITSTNIYVKFENTQRIEIGDTLFVAEKPCLLISEKSSTSVVATPINGCSVSKNDTVTYRLPAIPTTLEPPLPPVKSDSVKKPEKAENTQPQPESTTLEEIRGRVTVASYNTFSDVRDDRHRLQTRLSLNANHIGDSKFSIETDLAYRHVILPSESTYRGRTSIFNVYNLNARFEATQHLSITAGRYINNKVSTVGAVDGLQVEHYFGNFYVGALGGFRPDFFDYGFNSNLVQYGGFAGFESSTEEFYGQTTLGAIEQTNAGETDRRYVFFQHSSTIGSNLNLFGSAELDIFGNSGSETRLTNLYLSARYRFSRAVNVMLSYDSRKRIIYYETFQSDIERLLDDDLARQGLRARINLRPFKRFLLGGSYSRRFQSDNQNKSDNLYGYATLTKIPVLEGRLTVSYNNNQSNYLTSNVLSVRHGRNFFKDQLNADFYYRLADYEYGARNMAYTQHFYGTGMSYSFSRTWQLSISGEYSQFEEENSFRFYTRLTKRFYSKKKR